MDDRSRSADRLTQKILVHAINFAPELIGCAKCTTELAQYLAARGHEVEVVTAPPHYPGWIVRAPYRGSAYRQETLGSIRLIRCPMATKAGAAGVWRLLAPLSFAVAAAPIVAWRILRRRPDVVLCVEPTLFSAPAALLAAKLVGARSVLHVQDLEVDAAFELGRLRGASVRKAANFLERRLLGGFDCIVTISDKMRRALSAKGLEPAKVVVLRNWVDLDAIRPQPKSASNAFRLQLGFAEDDFVVLYAGHIGAKQALDVVFEAARRLADQRSIRFVVAGEGPALEGLLQTYRDAANVAFLPLQSAVRVNELLAMADLHVLPQHVGAADLVLPSKLGGMLASGRPIAATAKPGTEIADLLADIALLSAPGDDEALATSILTARSRDSSDKVARGLALAESFSAARLLPAFEQLLVEREGVRRREAGSAGAGSRSRAFVSKRPGYSIGFGLLAVLVAAELTARALGFVDVPVYRREPGTEYLPEAGQSGRFMNANDWYFNNESMPLAQDWKPGGAIDALLIGNSIVMGGNPYKQPEKLVAQIQSRLGARSTVWPIAVGGWNQPNEVAYLDRRPEIVRAAGYVAWEYMAGGLSSASAWRGEYVFPTQRPVSAAWYALRRYAIPWLVPGTLASELPPRGNAENAHAADFDRMLHDLAASTRSDRPGFIWLYPSQEQLRMARRGEEWLPERALIETMARRNGLRIVDVAAKIEWNESHYRDGLHPNVEGNRMLGSILAAEIAADVADRMISAVGQ
ncbi:WcaI family glycosyltransferase [Methylosinus sp. Sm6]|uniref:WcaI family glycosyltransferase n=1 Tax=Methylosinus sp. Sm6 TaxID=2866948 RepID=UPI001C99A960|nr:WcaI family glycosyltransferase [Methylosinus sp. Sm6]MBY6243400.1 WcaI family glycosyltransferase [Methylosinus sp. Sm6]